jgi:hypothetical protein
MYFNTAAKILEAKIARWTCEGCNARARAALASGLSTKDGMPEPFASQTKQPAAYRVCYTEA